MKKKEYFVEGEVKDSNGDLRHIVLLGVLTQEKIIDIKEKIVEVPVNEKKSVNGVLTFPRKQTIRKLTYSFSICHPEDKYDVNQGLKIARRRIETNPMGELETMYVTTLCDDQVKHILNGELQYIINNIDKFINKV